MCVLAPERRDSFHVFAIIVNSRAQLRKVVTVGRLSDLSVQCDGEKNSPLINGLELEHSTCTP